MESIIIGPDRIKIMLSGEELKNYGLHRNGDIDSCLTGTVLRKILRDAGFDTALSRLHVQVYDSKDNGCEMYVALLPEELTNDEEQEISVMIVEGKDDLLSLSSRLTQIGYTDTLSIYTDNTRIYALFDNPPPDFAGDYGNITGKDKIPYILEYAIPVCVKVTADGIGNYL